jgi:hypothetical protein
MTISKSETFTPLHVLSRTVASFLGSYVFVWGFVCLTSALGVAVGMTYGDAETLAALLAFLVFVACLCWAVAHPSLKRVWSLLLGGGAVMTGAGFWLMQTLS